MVLIALVSGGASILSLLERVQHGPGLLFADVEFLGFIAVIAAIWAQPCYSLPRNCLPSRNSRRGFGRTLIQIANRCVVKSLCDLRELSALGVVPNEPWKTGLFAFARERLVC